MGLTNSTNNKINKINLKEYKIYQTLSVNKISRIRVVENINQDSNIYTNYKYSVWKIMCKDNLIKNNLINNVKNEILIHSYLNNCRFITKFLGYNQTPGHVYLQIELCNKGCLFDLIRDKGCLSLLETKFYIVQIVFSLSYLKDNNIIYRDLKPENILICEDGYLKLTDFGISKMTKGNTKLYSVCGTTRYLAPEVINLYLIKKKLVYDEINNSIIDILTTNKNKKIKNGYNYSVDLWSLGVLIYECLVGIDPFVDSNELNIARNIIKGSINIPNGMDTKAVDLIKKLLCKNPADRLGYGKILNILDHEFFNDINTKEIYNKTFKGVSVNNDSIMPGNKSYLSEIERVPKIYNKNEDPFLKWDF